MSVDDADPGNLGGRAVRGASVVTIGQAVRIVTTLVATVVLSRLLTPGDFGLMAVVMSVVALGEVLRDFGLSTAASRAYDITPAQKSNLFWVNSGMGVVLAIAVAALSPVVAGVFGQAELEWIVLWIAPVLAFSGISAQFRAEINRRLRFATLTVVDTVPVALGVAGAIAWAVADPSPFALVVQQLTTALTGLILAAATARWWPGWMRRKAEMRSLFAFGGGLFGTQLTAYFARNTDNLALGYVWGPATLGLYSRAFQFLMLPINQLSAPLTRVAVPVLARIRDDASRFQGYLSSAQRLNIAILGVGYGLSIGLAAPLVEVIFGPQWTGMVLIFQVLAVGGIFKALSQVSFWAFLAAGKTGPQFRFYLISQPAIVVLMLAGLPWGAVGVAVGHTVGYALTWAFALWWCGRTVGIDAGSLAGDAVRGLALLVAPAALAASLASSLIHEPFAAIAVGVVGFIAIASLLLVVSRTMRATANEIRRVVLRLRPGT